MRIEFNNENGNKGGIVRNINTGTTTYIAVTASSSKTFKSLKGAKNFMAKFNYNEVI